jgi:hypothetical protein
MFDRISRSEKVLAETQARIAYLVNELDRIAALAENVTGTLIRIGEYLASVGTDEQYRIYLENALAVNHKTGW